MLLEFLEGDELKGGDVGGFEDDGAGFAGFEGLFPAGDADAPAVARVQAGEGPLGAGGDEIVSDFDLVLEELLGQDGADEVQAAVLRAGVAAAVAVEAGEGCGGAVLEFGSEDVLGWHGGVYAGEWRYARGRMNSSEAIIVTHPHADLGRTQRYFFRRRVTYGGGPAVLHLYADTRYRLFVDGRLVSTGPARSVPWVRPMFDTVDLAPELARGGGVLVVEVLCQRANNFQAMPGTPGGFLAFGYVNERGRAECESLETPGAWEVAVDPAWHFPTPHYSFAQGPTEVADLRLRSGDYLRGEGSGWTVPAGVDPSPYAAIAPSDLPLPSLVEEAFATGSDLGLSTSRELRVATSITVGPGGAGAEAFREGARLRFAFATFVHSPVEQAVSAGIFWGPNSLNGAALEQQNDALRGNRQNTTLNLRAGWNLLFGAPEFMGPVWGVMVAVPVDAGLMFRAQPDADCPDSMCITGTMPAEELGRIVGERHPSGRAELEGLGVDWRRVALGVAVPLPAREVAWDMYDPSAARVWDGRAAVSRRLRAGDVWSVVADFSTEYLGLAVASVTVPPDTTVDFAWEERTRADGAVQLFSSNPFCDMAERFILPAGTHELSPCQPRGGRVLQVTFRATADGVATLNRLGVIDVKRTVPSPASFTSADGLLEWAYDISRRTIERTLEDGYVDPWRERGLYLGDAYVAGLSHLCLTPDVSHVRHALRLFADGQTADGQFPCVVPAYLRDPHEDFTLIFVDFLRRYVRETGDLETAAYVYPSVVAMFSGSRWSVADSGLWSTDRGRVFLDWGVHPSLRTARENGCINALRYMSLRAAAEVAMALGRSGDYAEYSAGADRVRTAYNARLWLGAEEGFSPGFAPGPDAAAPLVSAPGKDAPRPPAEGSVLREHNIHVNLLALFSGVVAEGQEAAVLSVVRRQLAGNPAACRDGATHSGMAELYFLRFAMEALSRVGRVDLALEALRGHFAILRELKLVTLPESIHRAVLNRDSLCHCWGGWPVEFVTRRLVGVSLQRSNDRMRVRIAPDAACPLPTTLTCPVGTGLVRVSLGADRSTVELTNLAGGVYVPAGGRAEVRLVPGMNVLAGRES